MESVAHYAEGQQPLIVTSWGLETPANSPENSTNPAPGDAKNGALDPQTCAIDPALDALIDAWPTLPEAIQAGILAMVRAGNVRRELV